MLLDMWRILIFYVVGFIRTMFPTFNSVLSFLVTGILVTMSLFSSSASIAAFQLIWNFCKESLKHQIFLLLLPDAQLFFQHLMAVSIQTHLNAYAKVDL